MAAAFETSAMLLPDILLDSAQSSFTNGIVFGNTKASPYSSIERAANRLAMHLLQKRINPADRIVLVLHNSTEFIIACFAIWKVRGIVVPLDPSIRKAHFIHIIREIEPAGMIVSEGAIPELDSSLSTVSNLKAMLIKSSTSRSHAKREDSLDWVCESLTTEDPVFVRGGKPDDVVSITYTSGSTGQPKGVMHTHSTWLAGAMFTKDHLGISSADKMVIPLPLHHAYAFRQVLAYMLARGTLIIAADIYEAFKMLRKLSVTALLLVPAACNIALDHFASILQESGRTLRYIEIGAGAAEPERLRHLQRLLPNSLICLPYGLTEARVAFLEVGSDGQPNKIAAVAPGLALRVIGPGGKPTAKLQIGEIALRGIGLMAGYWCGDAAAKDRGKSWFRTGDLARVDECGKFSLVGRVDDLLKIGGRKVMPQEVESALNRHSAVLQSAVVGKVDQERIMEHKLHAYVVLRNGVKVTDEQLIVHCRRLLEPYKVPSKVHVCSSLPISSLGKLQRHLLRNKRPSHILAGNSTQGG